MINECSSGLGTPNLVEQKGDVCIQPKDFKSHIRYLDKFAFQSQMPLLHCTKFRGSESRNHFTAPNNLNVKSEPELLPNQEVLKDFKDE